MNVLDRVFGQLRANRVSAKANVWKQYKTVVMIPLSDGVEIDAEQCESLLTELGKSEDDLRTDLEVLAKRREWRQRLDAAEGARSQINAAEAKLAALDEEFAEQRRKYQARRSPVEQSLRDASQLVSSAIHVDRDLRNSIQDPDLTARMAANRDKLAELNRAIEPLVVQLSRNADFDGRPTIRYKIATIESELDRLTSNRSGVRAIADNLLKYTVGDKSGSEQRNKVLELNAKLAPLHEQRDAIEKELASLRGELRQAENEQRSLQTEALLP